MDFERGLAATVDWYRSNPEWIQHVRSGEYQTYYARNYEHRNRELSGIQLRIVPLFSQFRSPLCFTKTASSRPAGFSWSLDQPYHPASL